MKVAILLILFTLFSCSKTDEGDRIQILFSYHAYNHYYDVRITYINDEYEKVTIFIPKTQSFDYTGVLYKGDVVSIETTMPYTVLQIIANDEIHITNINHRLKVIL